MSYQLLVCCVNSFNFVLTLVVGFIMVESAETFEDLIETKYVDLYMNVSSCSRVCVRAYINIEFYTHYWALMTLVGMLW